MNFILLTLKVQMRLRVPTWTPYHHSNLKIETDLLTGWTQVSPHTYIMIPKLDPSLTRIYK